MPAERAAARRAPERDERAGADGKSGGVEPGTLLRTADPGARSTLEGRRQQDEEETDEDPFGLDSGLEGELGTPGDGDSGDGDSGHEDSAWDIALAPEDFVPETDLDVSGVPTGYGPVPGAEPPPRLPSFPEPPPTRAEQVQAERDREDAEEDTADRAETTSPAPDADGAADPFAAPGAVKRGAPPARAARPEGPRAAAAFAAGRPAVAEPLEAAEREPRTTGARDASGAEDVGPQGTRAGVDGEETEAAAERRQSDRAAAAGGSRSAAEQTSEPGGGASTGAAGAVSPGTADAAPAPSGTAQGTRPAAAPEGSGQDGPGGNTGTAGPQSNGGTAGDAGSGPSPAPGSDPGRPGVPDSASPVDGSGTRDTSGAGTERAGAPAPAPRPTAAPAPARPRAGGGPAPRTRGGGGGARTASGAGGGGGRARGTAPGKAKRQPAAPDLSAVSPEAGLSTAAGLKPHRALEALG
ncbi:hypothetical protein ACFVY9_08965, partial [Streptomyces sp. NPDC059544]